MIYNPQKDKFLRYIYISFFIIGAVSIWTSQKEFFTLNLYFVGQLLGVWALTTLSLQPLLGSRIPILEKGVGLDRILKIHSLNGKLLFLFSFLHPIFLFMPFIAGGLSADELLKSFTTYHLLGIIAFFLIVLMVVTTIYSQVIKLNYEHWKIIHKIAYVIIILGFAHSFYLGSDIVSKGPLFYWWSILGSIALIGSIYRYIIKTWLFRNSWYKIIAIIQETHDVKTIILEPVLGKVFKFIPGQFAYIDFDSKKVPSEEHHFTISSAPNDNNIAFSVKSSGDFTSMLADLKVGEKAKIEGPYGAFTNQGMSGPFLFIAGGIGITPIMSMLRKMQKDKFSKQSILIYANKSPDDIVFADDINIMEKQSLIKVLYIFSNDSVVNFSRKFYKGNVSEDILNEIKNIKDYTVFLVGPPPMMDAVKSLLLHLGVKQQNILTERFALR